MKTLKATTRDAKALEEAIRSKAHFRTNGALRGEYSVVSNTYTIWSYNEPIAVYHYGSRDALLSARKFSVTTSRHQAVTRRAIHAITPFHSNTDSLMYAHSHQTK